MKTVNFKTLFSKENAGKVVVREVCIDEDVEILGHVFHGLRDIEAHVEAHLYGGIEHGKITLRTPKEVCKVHVGELWEPYPCFDIYDYANENRSYQNFIFRKRRISTGDMKKLSNAPTGADACKVSEQMPADIVPAVYYFGSGDTMLVATLKTRKKKKPRFTEVEAKAIGLIRSFVKGTISDREFATSFNEVRKEFLQLLVVDGQPTFDKDTPLWLNSLLGMQFIDWIKYQQVKWYFEEHPEELVGETKERFERIRQKEYDERFMEACRCVLEIR